MSVFLIDHKIIGILSAYAADNDLVLYGPLYGKGIYSRKHVAVSLSQANIDSVDHRYPHHIDADSVSENKLYMDACVKSAESIQAKPSPGELAKMIDCLEYQASEPDNWYDSNAYKILSAIRTNLTRGLPGYEDAQWG